MSARYETPLALRRALTDRLKTAARDGGVALQELQRQYAYDRLLYRLFTGRDADRWVLKGATAVLARIGSDARHSLDVDLYSEMNDLDEAEQALRVAAARDVGDSFRFELTPGVRIAAQGADATRATVTAYLGASEFAGFHVDIVTNLAMTGRPETGGPVVRIDVPGIDTTAYRLYPIEDHIGDKVCALLESHPRAGAAPVASTRYRDLADLCVFAQTQTPYAKSLVTALRSETARRHLELPVELTVPAGPDWERGYARAVRDVPSLHGQGLDEAIALVNRFLMHVLHGKDSGQWDPIDQDWR